MAILRSYSKSEDAYVDAALLGGMGLDATVVDERGYGGNMLGTTTSAIRIELPEDQLDEARQHLAASVAQEAVAQAPEPFRAEVVPVSSGALPLFLRGILLLDIAWSLCVLFLPDWGFETPPPAVDDYLRSLAFSDRLWDLVAISFRPYILICLLSSVLCLFYLRLGRSLFAFAMVWGVLMMLGPPPQLLGPTAGFFGSLIGTLAPIALALMYWSPLSARFSERADRADKYPG